MSDETARRAIASLCIEWAFRVDHGPSDQVAPLFTEEGLFQTPEVECHGRAEIDASCSARAATRPVSRHVIANQQSFVEGPDDAHGRGIVTVYRLTDDGFGDSIPSSVFDFVDKYRRGEDGKWRFAERRMFRIFVHPSRAKHR